MFKTKVIESQNVLLPIFLRSLIPVELPYHGCDVVSLPTVFSDASLAGSIYTMETSKSGLPSMQDRSLLNIYQSIVTWTPSP